MQASDLIELSMSNPETLPIEEIALLVAKAHDPNLCLQSYRNRLDDYAHDARQRIGGVVGGPALARGLSHYLFEVEGFRGNRQDYYNPSNSLFNDVLDQRTGIPITLSILYIAVGRRLQLPLAGIGFPGHFLVRYHEAGAHFFIDPFNRGRLLTPEECQKRLQEQYGKALPYRPEYMEPSTHREILVRLLTNLKMAYMMRKEFENVITVLSQILLFAGDGAEELKERGLVYYHMECFNAAKQDLENYLARKPSSPDRELIRTFLHDLSTKIAQLQ